MGQTTIFVYYSRWSSIQGLFSILLGVLLYTGDVILYRVFEWTQPLQFTRKGCALSNDMTI